MQLFSQSTVEKIKNILSMASKPINCAGLEMVLIYTEKSCIASNCKQFFLDYENYYKN